MCQLTICTKHHQNSQIAFKIAVNFADALMRPLSFPGRPRPMARQDMPEFLTGAEDAQAVKDAPRA
jgi:hypothetical protein